MAVAEMTKLEAVNLMLSLVGQTPVETLGSGANAIVAMAENILNEVDRETQAMGWWFNTEKSVLYSPNKQNNVELGSDIFHVDSATKTVGGRGGLNKNYTKRGGKLYNLEDHTFTFTSDVSLDVIKALDWLDTPMLFRNFVAKRGGRILVERYLGDGNLITSAADQERRAHEAMTFENSRQSDRNFLTDNPMRFAALNRGGSGAIERGLI
jgi:hypothetical protein